MVGLCLNGPQGRVVGRGLMQEGGLIGVKRLNKSVSVIPACLKDVNDAD